MAQAEILEKVNQYIKQRDFVEHSARLYNDLMEFLRQKGLEMEFEDLKKITEARDTLSKFVWGNSTVQAWLEIEKAIKSK